MQASIHALAPVILVVAVGFTIRQIRYLPDSLWPALDHICWFLLFPLLIIRTLSRADLYTVPFTGLAGALLIAAGLMVGLLFACKPLLRRFGVTGPSYTSFFQGASRWNGFAALAIIRALYGDAGLVVGALSFAVLVPFLQAVNVAVLTRYGVPESGAQPFSSARLGWQLLKNPMLISIVLGLALNSLNTFTPFTLAESALFGTTVDLIAGSAIGLSLLAVGAGLKFHTIHRAKGLVVLSSVLKLVMMPLLIVVACDWFSVMNLSRDVAIICGAAPTAGTAYVMARQMGGDADTVAAIITVQTLAATITLPLMLYWLI